MTIYSCTFTAPGNPDHGQYAPVAAAQCWIGTSIEDCSKAALDYITMNWLGGGNWSSPVIYDDTGAIVGKVSYNGRVWEADGFQHLIFDPHFPIKRSA